MKLHAPRHNSAFGVLCDKNFLPWGTGVAGEIGPLVEAVATPGQIITCTACREAIKYTINSFKRYRFNPKPTENAEVDE